MMYYSPLLHRHMYFYVSSLRRSLDSRNIRYLYLQNPLSLSLNILLVIKRQYLTRHYDVGTGSAGAGAGARAGGGVGDLGDFAGADAGAESVIAVGFGTAFTSLTVFVSLTSRLRIFLNSEISYGPCGGHVSPSTLTPGPSKNLVSVCDKKIGSTPHRLVSHLLP